MKKEKKKTGEKILTAAACGCIVLITFFPMYVLVNVSLRSLSDLSSRLVPTVHPLPDNYRRILSDPFFWRSLLNTVLLFLFDTLFTIPLAAAAGYGLARTHGFVANAIRSFNVLLMMIPGTALLVGTYTLMVKMHLTNSILGLALLSAGGGMTGCMFFYTTFATMIPTELDDAAAIDGAGVLQTFFRVIMPQMKAVTVTRIISLLVGCWNSYLMPLYMLTKKGKYTVLLYMRELFSGSLGVKNVPLAFAGGVLMIMPVLVFYFLAQKQIIGSQIDSAVKG